KLRETTVSRITYTEATASARARHISVRPVAEFALATSRPMANISLPLARFGLRHEVKPCRHIEQASIFSWLLKR
ncbi:MAG TPA: hypothetical protein VGC82_03680, partial [Rhodopila sp.]